MTPILGRQRGRRYRSLTAAGKVTMIEPDGHRVYAGENRKGLASKKLKFWNADG